MPYRGQKFAVAYQTYVYSSWDRDLDSVAKRFRTTPELIRIASVRLNPEWRDLKTPVFAALLEDGQLINVPLPLEERGWHWFPYVPSSTETLEGICKKKNADKARAGMAPLSPQYVWLHVLNWQFREDHLRRNRPHMDDLDKDPSATSATPKSPTLWIPYPDTVQLGVVAVGTYDVVPKAAAAPPKQATVVVEHDWLYLLDKKLEDIGFYAERLAAANAFCEKVRMEYAAEAARLAPLRFLLGTMTEMNRSRNDVTALIAELDKLQGVTDTLMGINPAGIYRMPEDETRRSHSERLRDLLRSAELKSLVDKYLKEELDHDVNGDAARLNTISRALEAGYLAWGDGYYGDERDQDVENAVDVIGKSVGGAPPPEAKTALASILSLVGTPNEYPPLFRPKAAAPTGVPEPRSSARDVVPALGAAAAPALALMGNLPGPSTLSVAVVKLHVARLLVRKAANPDYQVAKRQWLLDIYKKVLRFNAEEEALMNKIIGEIDGAAGILKGTTLGGMLRDKALAESRTHVYESSRELAAKVGGRLQTSKAWSSGLVLLNAFALAAAWMAYTNGDDLTASLSGLTNAVNLGSAAFTTGVATLKCAEAFKFLSGIPRAHNLVQSLANLSPAASAGFGVVSGIFCLVAGGATMLDNWRDPLGTSFTSGALQFLGGVSFEVAAIAVILGASPAAPLVIGAEITGGLCLVASALFADKDALDKLLEPATKKIFRYHIGKFKQTKQYQTMVKNGHTELESALKAVESATDAAVFADFDETFRPRVEALLRDKFADQDIGHMFTTVPLGTVRRQ
ncbi:Hypothetical protein A7982_06525 [Minicystis rosea]|nr:Hypothetical protein A7982_06525 [Minicystis rosea]